MDNPDVNFVGVASRDSEEAMTAFIGATGVGIFPHVNDVDAEIWREYGIGYQPAFVFVKANGTTSTFGALDQDGIQQRIDDLF